MLALFGEEGQTNCRHVLIARGMKHRAGLRSSSLSKNGIQVIICLAGLVHALEVTIRLVVGHSVCDLHIHWGLLIKIKHIHFSPIDHK